MPPLTHVRGFAEDATVLAVAVLLWPVGLACRDADPRHPFRSAAGVLGRWYRGLTG